MPQQEVAFRAFTAIHAFVVLEDVFHLVNLHGIISLDLATVTAEDLHA